MSDRGYTLDLRQRVIDAHQNSEGSYTVLADRFKISRGCVYNWVKLVRETGSVAPRPHGGGAEALIDEKGEALLAQWLSERSDWILSELVEHLEVEGYEVSESTVSRTLAKIEITRKKGQSAPANSPALTLRRRAPRGLGV